MQDKITGFFGNFSHHGGCLPNSQNFCKFSKSFLVCQIHSEAIDYIGENGKMLVFTRGLVRVKAKLTFVYSFSMV